MATVAKKLLTAEEFAALPPLEDGSLQELVCGEVITMSPPKARHGACCAAIVLQLGSFVKSNRLGTVTCNDSGVLIRQDPDTVRGPDVAYWSRERLPEISETYVEIPPDLVAEVVSPSDVFSHVQRKVREYLERGVRLVWVVDPENLELSIYRPGQQPRIFSEGETVTGEDVLPGFTCRVADLLP
jgi:Uma2 family endonuclease